LGKTKERHWRDAEVNYIERIQRYARLQEIFVKEAAQNALKNEQLVRQVEAGQLLARIAPDEFVVALDNCGKEMTSEKFSDFVGKRMLHGMNRLTFVIGGPLGLDPDFTDSANLKLSLSKMTLPHELAKVFLLEQIYRAFTILKGEKYHK